MATMFDILTKQGQYSVDYLGWMHDNKQWDNNGMITPWNRPLYITGNLRHSYHYYIVNATPERGELQVKNTAEYSDDLADWPHVYWNTSQATKLEEICDDYVANLLGF